MRKSVLTATIRKEAIDFLDHISEMNSTSRSKINELLIDIVKDYFTDEQIAMELKVRGNSDGRINRQKKDEAN